MKKTYFLFLVLLVTGNLQAQVFWLNDLETGKNLAKESERLIVMGFLGQLVWSVQYHGSKTLANCRNGGNFQKFCRGEN